MSTKKEFINIKIKSGNRFYTSSKNPIKGAEKVETKLGDYYHTEVPNIKSNKLLSVGVYDSPYGEVLQFLMEGEGETILSFSIPTINSKGRLDSFAASAARYLGNLEVGKPIEISLNKKDTNPNGYLYANMFFRQGGEENVRWVFDNDDVPPGTEKINKVTKKSEYDYQDRDAFLYDKIKEACKNLKGSKSTLDNYPVAKSEMKIVPVDDDDLPF